MYKALLCFLLRSPQISLLFVGRRRPPTPAPQVTNGGRAAACSPWPWHSFCLPSRVERFSLSSTDCLLPGGKITRATGAGLCNTSCISSYSVACLRLFRLHENASGGRYQVSTTPKCAYLCIIFIHSSRIGYERVRLRYLTASVCFFCF